MINPLDSGPFSRTASISAFLLVSVLIGPAVSGSEHPALPKDLRGDVCAVRLHSLHFFGALRTDPPNARPHLYRMDFATSNVSRLLADDVENSLLGGVCHQLAASPDGASLALVVAVKASSPAAATRVVILDTATQAVREVVANGRWNSHVSFSPDGKQIAFYHQSPDAGTDAAYRARSPFTVAVADSMTGAIRPLAEAPGRRSDDSGPTWSPDGRWLAYASMTGPTSGSAMMIVSVAGGAPRRVTPTSVLLCAHAVWVNDDVILYAGIGERGVRGLHAIKPDGTGNRDVFRGTVTRPPSVSPDGERICFEGIPIESANQRQKRTILINPHGDRLVGPVHSVFYGKWRF